MERGIRFRSGEEEIANGRTDLRDVDWLVELAGEDVLGGGVLVLGELDVAGGVAAGGVLRHGHRPRPRSRRRRERKATVRSHHTEWERDLPFLVPTEKEEWASDGPAGLLLSFFLAIDHQHIYIIKNHKVRYIYHYSKKKLDIYHDFK